LSQEHPSEVQASLYLAKYFFNTRSFDDAELHLIAPRSARRQKKKRSTSPSQTDIIEFRGTKSEALII